MSDHTRALVPIDCWMYCSPDLFEKNRTVDVGLLAEALIYYEQVLVNVSNPLQLAELVRWFIRHGVYREFVSLIQEGTIQIYNYAFYTLCFVDEVITLLNITDEVMEKPNSFPKRFLENKEFRNAFSTHKQYSEFCNTVNGRVIEVKATEFGDAGVQNASRDCLATHAAAL